MNAYYFRRGKTAVLGAKKARLLFSEGKYQLQNSWNTIPFPTIFYHLNFQLPHPNRSNNVSSHSQISLLQAITRYEKAENCILSLYPIISRWVPLIRERFCSFASLTNKHFECFTRKKTRDSFTIKLGKRKKNFNEKKAKKLTVRTGWRKF